MGMFDWYQPTPTLKCPQCQGDLQGWQGKAGPCGLFEWVQGHAHPSRQLVDDEVTMDSSELVGLFLPEEFELYTSCESCQTWISAHGWCECGTWTQVALVGPLEPPGIPENWSLLTEDDRHHLRAELRREIAPGHMLYGRSLLPIARHRERDDVLVRTIGTPNPLWIIHLTWRAESTPERPHAQSFPDLTTFVCEQNA
jgi:hypothetical protein